MKIFTSWLLFAGFIAVAVGLLTVGCGSAHTPDSSVSVMPSGHVGLIQSWSTHYVVFPQNGPNAHLLAAQNEPRAFMSWQMALNARKNPEQELLGKPLQPPLHEPIRHPKESLHRDWSITLAGTANPGAYPA